MIALGVPTVIDAATLCADLSEKAGGGEGMYEKFREAGGDMIVTPKDIDMLTSRAAKLVALALNCAMQPSISPEDMLTLTG